MIRNNFCKFCFKNICCDLSSKPSQLDSSDEGSQLFVRSFCSAAPQFFSSNKGSVFVYTVIILNIGTDRSEQTVQTQIRLLLMEQSDQGLLYLLFCLHLLNTILHCKIQLFQL